MMHARDHTFTPIICEQSYFVFLSQVFGDVTNG